MVWSHTPRLKIASDLLKPDGQARKHAKLGGKRDMFELNERGAKVGTERVGSTKGLVL